MLTTKIKKWGNSFAVRLPKEIMEKYELKEEERVAFSEKDGAIQLVPLRDYSSIKELIAGITPKNRHEETDWGKSVKGEIW